MVPEPAASRPPANTEDADGPFLFNTVPTVPCICDSSHERRIAARVRVDEDGCWNWKLRVTDDGYGLITHKVNGKLRVVGAHRFSYEATLGPIPFGLTLDHLCRNRRCVNPSHLEPVTNYENWRRGNSPAAINARRTHCHRGHKLPPVGSARYRTCQACLAEMRATPAHPSHGTTNGYVNYGCRCDRCRSAHYAYWQTLPAARARLEERARRMASRPESLASRLRSGMALPEGDPRHGTVNGYNNGRCRCEPCSQAAAERNRRQREARKTQGVA